MEQMGWLRKDVEALQSGRMHDALRPVTPQGSGLGPSGTPNRMDHKEWSITGGDWVQQSPNKLFHSLHTTTQMSFNYKLVLT